jgi:hypothetical protein
LVDLRRAAARAGAAGATPGSGAGRMAVGRSGQPPRRRRPGAAGLAPGRTVVTAAGCTANADPAPPTRTLGGRPWARAERPLPALARVSPGRCGGRSPGSGHASGTRRTTGSSAPPSLWGPIRLPPRRRRPSTVAPDEAAPAGAGRAGLGMHLLETMPKAEQRPFAPAGARRVRYARDASPPSEYRCRAFRRAAPAPELCTRGRADGASRRRFCVSTLSPRMGDTNHLVIHAPREWMTESRRRRTPSHSSGEWMTANGRCRTGSYSYREWMTASHGCRTGSDASGEWMTVRGGPGPRSHSHGAYLRQAGPVAGRPGPREAQGEGAWLQGTGPLTGQRGPWRGQRRGRGPMSATIGPPLARGAPAAVAGTTPHGRRGRRRMSPACRPPLATGAPAGGPRR